MPRILLKAMMAALATSLLMTTGCVSSSTPYQPISAANRIAGGYSDEQIGEDRYRISFAGNSLPRANKWKVISCSAQPN